MDPNQLSTVSLFSEISDDAREAIASMMEQKSFGKDENIVQEGDVADAMYFILSGSVNYVKDLGSRTKDVRATGFAGMYFRLVEEVEEVEALFRMLRVV